jgi:hypothetical protein
MEKIKYEKLATLAADGTRVECSSFAIRRRLKKLVSPEEYNSVLQKRKEAFKFGNVLPAELPDKDDGNKYDWVVVGDGKYDKIMYCLKTKQFRHETMGEFYENLVVD